MSTTTATTDDDVLNKDDKDVKKTETADEIVQEEEERRRREKFIEEFRERYERLKDHECFVTEIEIRNINNSSSNEGKHGHKSLRTQERLIKRCFKSVENSGTLEEAKDCLLIAREELESYGIFKTINITLDESSTRTQSSQSQSSFVPNSAKIIVDVEERDVLNLKAGTFVSQTGEGTVEITGGLKNAIGFAEKIDFELIRGHEKSASYALHWEQPKVLQTDITTQLRIFQQHQCQVKHSSFHDTGRGLSFQLSSPERPATLEYNLIWREITDPTRFASKAVRKMCGHSLKSSIVHTLAGESENNNEQNFEELNSNNNNNNRSNWWWNVRTELAGLNPVFDSTTEAFLKSEYHAKYARNFPNKVNDFLPEKLKHSLSWQLGVRAGIIMPLQKDGESNIADRFFMGGCGSLRMFEPHGAGPCDLRREKELSSPARGGGTPGGGRRGVSGTASTSSATPPTHAGVQVSSNLMPPRSVQSSSPYDSIGGDIVLSGTASVKMDIPVEKLRNIGVHAHAFVNAGFLIPHAASGKMKDSFKVSKFRDSLRASCGAGIVWPLPLGNIELNFGRVLMASSTDRVNRSKFQVGLAASLSA
jgi:outer membrane protein insertion porin family